MKESPPERMGWFGIGDINAFFGLMIDNVTNLIILSGIMVGIYKYPAEILHTKMIPGTALGVLIGDLIYTLMAIRLAKREGRRDVTAMPLGLDTPSTIGIAISVLGPTYLETKDPILTWQVGMATLVFMGVVKVITSFFGNWVQKKVPRAGLLGSLAGIGLVLLAFLPLVKVFELPLVGMVSLGLIIYTLIVRLPLPGRFPGAFGAILIATSIYYITGAPDTGAGLHKGPEWSLTLAIPFPRIDFIYGLDEAIKYLPIAVPFGILTIVGGINVTESARVAGDDYRTKYILLTEAFATLIAGFCGGVAQSTPYIGHPAYKSMGGRAGYTLLTGLFIGLGGILGYISAIIEIIPEAAVAPILIFVGVEIMIQAFTACEKRHYPAVVFAFLPIVAELVRIEITAVMAGGGTSLSLLPPDTRNTVQTITILGHGFIVTAMLWGGTVSLMIDRRFKGASIFLMVCALLTLTGFIHSILPDGGIYLPWAVGGESHYTIALAYFILGILCLLISSRIIKR